jgi:aminoglycoside phosphotransferase (APT) family kinase protein
MDEVTHSWILEVLNAHDAREVRTLTFGITSDMRLIEVDGSPLVLRRYVTNEIVAELPMIVEREARALTEARVALGNLVPELVAYDVSGVHSGCPSLIMSFLPGEPVIHDIALQQIAEPLALLRDTTAPMDFPHYHPRFNVDRLAVPRWTKRPKTWAALIHALDDGEPSATEAFLHRDYHPGNLLWERGSLSGIVDWPNSCRGPRGVDVAHARGNLALVDGVVEAERFLRDYREVVPSYDHDPWWDIADLLSFDSDFAGVMAFNAFGASLLIEDLCARADDWAHALAMTI